MVKRRKRKGGFWKFIFNVIKIFFISVVKLIWFIIKLPYLLIKYLVSGTSYFLTKEKQHIEKEKIEKRRGSMKPFYKELKIIQGSAEEYKKWEKKVFDSDSVIGIILGARGSGKTAFGIKFLENFYSKKKSKCYAIGFKREEMPSWIKVVQNVSELENNSFVLIDEGGVLFSARKAMTSANKMLSDLMLIARHKNISILFISQNSSNLEVNILRQADFLILKPSSLLQRNFERKIIQEIYTDTMRDFKKFKKEKGLAYVYSDEFTGFVSNNLPSFWNIRISKSFK